MSFALCFQLILSSCVSFICWFVMITFIVLLPLRLVCSAVVLSSTRCTSVQPVAIAAICMILSSTLYTFPLSLALSFSLSYYWCALLSSLVSNAHNRNHPFNLLSSSHTRLSVLL